MPQFRPAQCADLASRHGWQCRWWLRWLVWWRHWQTRRHRQRRRHVNWQRQNRRRHLNRQRQRRRWHHRLHRQCLRARAGRRRPIRLCATLLLVLAMGINGDRIALDSKWSTSLFLSKKVFIPLQSVLALFQGIAKLQHCPGCACEQALLSIHLALELFEAGDLVKTSTLNRLEIAGTFACWKLCCEYCPGEHLDKEDPRAH